MLAELFQFGLQLAEFRVAFDAFDLLADSCFLFLQSIHVDFVPWHVGYDSCELMLVLQQADGVGHLFASTVGVLQRLLRLVELVFQFGQVLFVHEADDLVQSFAAVESTVAGFDLTVGLHLSFAAVRVVDGVNATRVEVRRRRLCFQPSDERRIFPILQFRRHPALAAGGIVSNAGIDEPPGAARHEVRVDGADFRRESLFVAFVNENGLRDGRVGDVHRQAPLFAPFVHIHQFGHIRQLGRVQSGRPHDERARVVHIVADACF